MKNCPQCHTAQESDNLTSCPACGYNYAAQTDPIPTKPVDDDDDLEFQVYEQESDDREFVGGKSDFEGKDKKDDLGLQTTGDLMESQAHAHASPSQPADDDFEPIGQSAPFIPTPEPYDPGPSPSDFADIPNEPPSTEPEPESPRNGIKKLSEEEIRAIENNLYNGNGYLSDSDKLDLMHKIESRDQLFMATPIVPPKKTEKTDLSPDSIEKINEEIDESLPSPKMANRGKGIALYYRNLVQLRGTQNLTPGDELIVAGRTYELRPKSLDRKVLISAGAVLFIVLLFAIGPLLVSSPSGNGQIAGIVLDENNQPFLQEATISLPDLGEQIKSNAQGMFVTGPVPSGSHRVELIWNGKTWGADYATVVDDQISVIVMRPTGEPSYGTVPHQPTAPAQASVSSSAPARPAPPTDTRQAAASESSAQKKQEPNAKPATTSKKTSSDPAKLVLAANVEGARLKLNDNVLGAGNLTYSNVKPGTYRYEVSRDGYKTASGQISIAGGEQQTLAVTLERLPQQTKATEYSADDFYLSGLAALQENDFKAAITDLSEAVRRDPGNADANFSLGEAYAGEKQWKPAHDAFLRAAEQYQIKRDNSRAITAYNQAIQADGESLPAYLGRGSLFLGQKEDRAAVVDFETAVRIDKRSAAGYMGLGRARFEQGLYDKAIKHFKDARSIDATNPLVHQYLMLCYMADSDFDEVKKTYEKFAQVASQEELKSMRSDSRYAAVMRVVEGKK